MDGESWSPARRIAFRFGVITGGHLMLAHGFVFALVPGTERMFYALLVGWHRIACWLGALLGLDVPPLAFTGSGDQLFHYLQLLTIAIAAVFGTLAWTLLSRRRAYPRLAAAATVALRYYLASVLIGYGMAKVVPMQFPPLFLARYDQAIGEMSPMGLLWSFMGHSQAYTWFAGCAEVVGSVLLLWRRTYVIGALVLAAVMTNVVLLNFCYDVPVKLFSTQLLVMLLVLVAPHVRRIVASLLGRATREVPPRVRGTPSAERVRLALKLVVIALIAMRAYGYVVFADGLRQWRAPSPLHGAWRAERVVIDGVEHPPLLTDDVRWRKVIFHEHGLAIRFATDRRRYMRAEVDDKAHTITVDQGVRRAVWRYTRPDAEHLVVDTPRIHAELVLEPPPLLSSRGFHWVQEEPYNR
jgi:uncharacterized membrane protein YphA (DoxX/SURF4 family)